MNKFKLPDIAIINGAALGLGAVLLTLLGNPANSGICISCFMENLAGALQLQDGFLLGSFYMAVKTKRFHVTGGSSPVIRFFLGFFIIVGCAVFIGCPIKLILRLAAGDLTAVAALLGLMFGIWLGSKYIRAGVFLDREKQLPKINGYIFPAIAVLLLIFLVLKPSFIREGQTGPAAQHAPLLISLGISLFIGALSQRSGLCITGGIRNFFLVGEKTLLYGVITTFVSAMLLSMVTGLFHLGMNGQPASHMGHGWTFLAMTLVGLASVIVDGCPFRQIVKVGQGDMDAGITCFGMLTGAAFVITWLLRSTSAGPSFNGKIAVLGGLIFCIVIVLSYRNQPAKR